MTHRLAPGLLVALVLTGCGAGGGDPVADSMLPAHDLTTPAGPAYLTQELGKRDFRWTVVSGGASRDLGRLDDATWLPDGRVLVQRSTTSRSNGGPYSTRTRLEVLDAATGEVQAQRAGSGQWGVTPDAITVLNERRNRIVVYSGDLDDRTVLNVPDSAVETDQLDPESAELSLHHAAYTLAGVTWVQWGVNSEDDTKTDHGVLRIEGGEPTEVLRNEPVVALLPSRDGAALLVLMQDNGEDESCGGCVVEQTLVELDPATGEVGAEYGMPGDYDRSWRVETVDKVGREVVARFAIGESEAAGDPGVTRQTWVYDGGWERKAELDELRTWRQQDGQLRWRQRDTLRDEGEFAAVELSWLPHDGDPVEIFGEDHPCPRRHGAEQCPLILAPGSPLPSG